ncbi:Nuclear cap-binding protein subunit 1, partial [Spiromyces aspiralis]
MPQTLNTAKHPYKGMFSLMSKFAVNPGSRPYGGARDGARGEFDEFGRQRRSRFNHGNRKPYDRPGRRGRGGASESSSPALDVEKRLSTLIAKVGDKASDNIRNNLDTLSGVIHRDFSKYSKSIVDALTEWQVTIYATLIGLVNAKSFDTGQAILTSIHGRLGNALSQEDWSTAKVILRFFGVLLSTKAINSTTLLAMYDRILENVSAASKQTVLNDCLTYLVLSTLPWSGKSLNQESPAELELVVARINGYLDKRVDTFNSRITHIFANEPATVDGLNWLRRFVSVMPNSDWSLNTVKTPYDDFQEELSSAMQHSFPPLSVPTVTSEQKRRENRPHVPRPTLQLFDFDTTKKVQRFVIQDLIFDTFNQLEINRKECARCVLGIFNACLPGVATSIQLELGEGKTGSDENASKGGLVIERLVMESLMTALLMMPAQHNRDVYYSALTVEICKIGSEATFHIIGATIRNIFAKMTQMEVESIDRFCSWFTVFISNFGYQWGWAEWTSILEKPADNDQQKTFVKESLLKCVRLAYFERIKQILPEQYLKAEGVVPARAPGPKFKFTVDMMDERTKAVSVAVGKCIKAKGTAEQVAEILEEHYGTWQDVTEEQRQMLAREMLIQHILLAGSKTFSHMLNSIERYMPVLQKYAEDLKDKLQIAKVTEEFWINNPQMYVITLDKLLNYRVIDPITVMEAIFDVAHVGQWNRFHYWEALHNTVQKVNLRVVQLKDRLEHIRSNRGRYDDDDEDETANVSSSQIEGYEQTLAQLRQEQRNVVTKTIE